MANPISAEALNKMINYYYMVSFCPPQHIKDLKKASQKTRTRLARGAGLKMKEFTDLVQPEVARRMAAFQQASREPEAEAVQELTRVLKGADSNPKKAAAYQTALWQLAAHPGRAKPENRLHRQKGCAFCAAPCLYAYFTLMSEPDFNTLRDMLEEENGKPAGERDPLRVLWAFTRTHFWKVIGAQAGYVSAVHLGNLSYCLLLLGMARSRFELPRDELTFYQILNQLNIRRLGAAPISLAAPG
jgi:hypothetical protein